jgi:hypothetical protein
MPLQQKNVNGKGAGHRAPPSFIFPESSDKMPFKKGNS